MSSRAGFTLLELLVVMTLMAAVLAVAPFFGQSLIDRVRLSFAIRAATAEIYSAEARALRDNQIIRLVPTDFARGGATQVTLRNDALAPVSALQFFPDRSAIGGILSLSRGKQRRVLRIDTLTGAVDAPD